MLQIHELYDTKSMPRSGEMQESYNSKPIKNNTNEKK